MPKISDNNSVANLVVEHVFVVLDFLLIRCWVLWSDRWKYFWAATKQDVSTWSVISEWHKNEGFFHACVWIPLDWVYL